MLVYLTYNFLFHKAYLNFFRKNKKCQVPIYYIWNFSNKVLKLIDGTTNFKKIEPSF